MVELIAKKRDGLAFTREDTAYVVRAYTYGEIPDHQMAALQMATYINGMTEEETVNLAVEMAAMTEQVDFSGVKGPIVDKHSTGGVGDKTSLVALPIAASLGVKVAKVTSRGLAHTGGTMDRMESIPGYRTNIGPREFVEIVKRVGISITGHSGRVSVSDKKLYALRDAVGTAADPAMNAANFMGKKIASGANLVVLDVKVGSGGLVHTMEQARQQARSMIKLGEHLGIGTVALLSNMDMPLGRSVGNLLEVLEAVNTLRGKGPKDLTLLSTEIAANMVALATKTDMATSREQCRQALADGKAFAKFLEMVELHGGDVSCLTHPEQLRRAQLMHEVKASRSGYIQQMDCKQVGTAAVLLESGRETRDISVDYTAGLVALKKTGERVAAGEPIARFYTATPERLKLAEEIYLPAVQIGDTPPEKQLLVYGRMDKDSL